MSNFDWYEEEDLRWEDSPPQKPERPPRRWPRWVLIVLLVLAILGAGGTAVYQRLTNRVDEVSFEVKSAIRRSHALIYQSAQEHDKELFVTLLSGRNDAWAAAQERVVGAGLLFARNGFGLTWLPGDADMAVQDISISPDLTAAVLTATHEYALDVGNGLSQTVTLAQTAVYRRGPDRWLFSPPEDDFWGETLVSEGELLTMSYPARDTAVSRRLAADIEAKINEMCNRLDDLGCPDDLHLRVDLSPSPTAVYETNKLPGNSTLYVPSMRSFGWYSFPARLEGKEDVLTLPAPTLFGLPQDEAGYQALYRGYTARAISALIAELVGWECCAEDAFFQAALDMQLAQLGLRPWPVQPGDYKAMLGKDVLEVYQAGLDGNQAYLHMLVAFLAEEMGISPAGLQHNLAQSQQTDEELAWLNEAGHVTAESMADVNRFWLGFVYGRSRQDQTPPPITFPDQVLQLVCRSADAEEATLYRYDPSTEELAVEWVLNRPTAVLFPLPDRTGSIVAEQNTAPNSVARAFIFRDGAVGQSLGYGVNGSSAPTPLAASPDGRYILFYEQNDRSLPYASLDWPACREEGECAVQPRLGAVQWSPNGQRVVLYGNRSGDQDWHMLFLADEIGHDTQFVAVGRVATWLDDETAVFESESGRIMQVDVSTLEPTSLFSKRELAASLDVMERRSRASLQITFLAAQPQDAQQILIGATDGSSGYLFRYDRAADKITPVYSQDFRPEAFPPDKQFSPDGRLLLQLVIPKEDTGWAVALTDWETAVSQTYPIINLDQPWLGRLVDWSEDGQWLALTADGYVRLIAPDYNYQRWFIPSDLACDQAIWLNK